MTNFEHRIKATEEELTRLRERLAWKEEHLDYLHCAFKVLYPTVNWWVKAEASGHFKPKF